MYLHLGQDVMVNTKDVIGLFDLDTASLSKHTRAFLTRAEKEKRVVVTSTELPKSFLVVEDTSKSSVIISQLSSGTLKGRVEQLKRKRF